VSVVVDLVTVVVAAQSTRERADGGIQHGVGVGSAGFGAHSGALAAAGDHDPEGRLRLPGVLLAVQFDVMAKDVTVEVVEVGQLVGDVRTVMVGNSDVATCHDDLGWDVHHDLPGSVDFPDASDADLLGVCRANCAEIHYRRWDRDVPSRAPGPGDDVG
jgi:hypothetical protein